MPPTIVKKEGNFLIKSFEFSNKYTERSKVIIIARDIENLKWKFYFYRSSKTKEHIIKITIANVTTKQAFMQSYFESINSFSIKACFYYSVY